jgi:DNA polymerase-3 subunit delta'
VSLPAWTERAYRRAMDALRDGRLPHALLVSGPERLGKLELARALARRLLCSSPTAQDHACGNCRGCVLMRSGAHGDYTEITFELNDKGEPRSEITIDQIRRLGAQMVLTPQLGVNRVFVLHPADALNRSAFNALLKTLEEPPEGRYLILVSDHPFRLPATIRSRCQRLEVRVPPTEESLAWLAQQGHDAAASAKALDFARGHPGLALHELAQGTGALSREIAKDLVSISAGRESAVEVAQRWNDERIDARLSAAADAVAEFGLRHAQGAGAASRLARAGLSDADVRRMGNWFDLANRSRDQLRSTLRTDLLLIDLLRQWRQASAQGAKIPTVDHDQRRG